MRSTPWLSGVGLLLSVTLLIGATAAAEESKQPSALELIPKLKSADVKERQTAVAALKKLKEAAVPAVDALIFALSDADSIVRDGAAGALGEIGPAAEKAVPELVKALRDKTAPIGAAGALGEIEKSPELCVPALIEALKSGDDSTRFNAALSLGQFGTSASEAVPALIDTMADKHAGEVAAQSLGKIKADPKRCIPALLQILKTGPNSSKDGAAKALGEFGPDAKEAVPILLRLLKDDGISKSTAAEALGGIKSEPEQCVPVLIEILRDEKSLAQGEAAYALGEFGPAAAAAVPELARLVSGKHIDGFVLGPVVHGLSGIGKAGLPKLMELVTNGDNIIRHEAAQAIWKMKGSAAGAVPDLIKLLEDKDDDEAREVAAETLGEIGTAAKAALPALIKASQDQNNPNRELAAAAVFKIDAEAAKAAGIKHPLTTYYMFIQQKRRAFDKRELSVGSDGIVDGPFTLWLNGDPIDFFTGGGSMMPLNAWIMPGRNELTVSGHHIAPLYTLVAPNAAWDYGEVIGQRAFMPPGRDELDAPLVFNADQAPVLPKRDELSEVPQDELQKQVEQQIHRLVELVNAHKGKEAAEMLFAGERLWGKAGYGRNNKESQTEIDQAAKNIADPKTTITGPQRPVQLIVGKRLLIALAEKPTQGAKKQEPLLLLKNGKNSSSVSYLQFARVDGNLIIWNSPSGLSISISAEKSSDTK